MNEKKHELLTSSQTIGLLIGCAIGPEFLRLPNLLVEAGGQDSWISASIALIYPLYVVILASIIIKKHPKDNIIDLNKKYFGKIIGTILNIIFMIQFVIYTGYIVPEFSRISRMYIVGFLSAEKIIATCIAISFYAAYKGLKVLGKINEASTYFILIVILLTVFVFKEGSITNLKPVFETGTSGILKSSVKAAYFYTGFEALLVIHPQIKDSKKIRASAVKAVLISGIIWVWTVFATIYYLGIDIIPKTMWSVFLLYDCIVFPIINNVRYIFMFVWSLATFRIAANYMFMSNFMIGKVTGLSTRKVYYILIPLVFYISLKFTDNILRQQAFCFMYPVYIIFNLVNISALALLIKIKSHFN